MDNKEKITIEDITDIVLTKADYRWNSGYNEFTFNCKINEKENELYLTEERHDDGTSFIINSKIDDIWEKLSPNDAYKLEDLLQEKRQYGVYHNKIEKLSTLRDCEYMKWDFMENDNPYFNRVRSQLQAELDKKKEELALDNDKDIENDDIDLTF